MLQTPQYSKVTSYGKSLLEKAKKGNLQAQRDIGCLHIWGEEGFPKDEQQARNWYRLAAEKDHCEAMWDLAGMYIDGVGGEVNIIKALYFLKKAASRQRWAYGTDNCAKFLEEIYRQGLYGLEKDSTQANYWANVYQNLQRKYRGWKRKRKN